MKKVKLVSFILLMFMIPFITACSSGNESADDGKVRIRFATWEVAESVDFQQKMVDEFNKNNDKIEVVLEAYGSDYDTKISAGMGAKDAPDVMYMWNYPQYVDGLEPLDSYIEEMGEEYKDNFYESLWSYNSIDGKIYGIPVGYTSHVVYYNKDLFDEKGIEYPTSGWTWDDFQEIARQITDEANDTIGFVFPGKPDPYDFEMFLWSNGTAYVDEHGSLEGNINSPESIEVFETFQNMLKEGIAITSERSGETEMKTGKVGLWINGAWYLSSLEKAGINFGVVELPRFNDKESVSVLSSSGLSISANSKHKEEAFEFIKYWTGEELNKARIGSELPVLKSVVADEKLQEDEKLSVFYNMLEQSVGHTPSSFIVDDWSRISEDLSLAFEQIFNPSTLYDPAEVLNSLVE